MSSGGVAVRFTGFEPSAFMIQIARSFGTPPRADVKAIFSPSGDQAGVSSMPAVFVRFTTFEPSASIAWTS
jgi:hypothetical protein